MTRPNITHGPWNFTKGIIPCINASIDRHQITVAKTIYGSHDEALANARAIAALPNLLDTLEACLQSLEDCWKLTNGECGGTRDIGTRNLIGEKIDWIKNALRLAGYEF